MLKIDFPFFVANLFGVTQQFEIHLMSSVYRYHLKCAISSYTVCVSVKATYKEMRWVVRE